MLRDVLLTPSKDDVPRDATAFREDVNKDQIVKVESLGEQPHIVTRYSVVEHCC